MKNTSTRNNKPPHKPLSPSLLKRYEPLLQTRLFGVVISYSDGTICKINDRFLDMLGYSRKEYEEGKLTQTCVTPRMYDDLTHSKLEELKVHSYVDFFEKEYLHKNGRSITVLVGAESINPRTGLYISYSIDVSAQKQSEKKKDEVLATVGHEIKTPLSVLRVQAELMMLQAKKKKPRKKLLRDLMQFDESIGQLDKVLSSILMNNTVARAGNALQPTVFDVSLTLKKVVTSIKLLSRRKIYIERADKGSFIKGDETEISEVLINIISNAIKYSSDDTGVTVSCKRDGKLIKIAVQDWGRGIRKVDQKKIFQKSYQVRQPDNNGLKDSRGLGLYLCDEIVSKHNGKILLESKLNEGSTFTCVFNAVDPKSSS
jgi:PAS domain S-box-containing protein